MKQKKMRLPVRGEGVFLGMEDGVCDQRTKEFDYLAEKTRCRIWETREGDWDIGKHDKILLPSKSGKFQNTARRTYLPAVRQAREADSGATGKEVLLRRMPEEVVERSYGADEGKRRLRPLRKTVSRQGWQKILLPCLLHRGQIWRRPCLVKRWNGKRRTNPPCACSAPFGKRASFPARITLKPSG